jgi:ATP-dependent helicase HrpB
MVGGTGVVQGPESAVTGAPLFVALELTAPTPGTHAEALVRKAVAVEAGWLPAARVLATAAVADLSRALPLADPAVASWLARVRFLARARPELGLPRFADAELAALLPVLATGRRSFDELRRAPLLPALAGALTWPQREALEREAPERLLVPSGSRIRLVYEEGRPPVLPVRIQELFGASDTPRLAVGPAPGAAAEETGTAVDTEPDISMP